MLEFYAKDPYRNEWDSKLDRLSLAVASRFGGEYWTSGKRGSCMVHAIEGTIHVPAGCIPSIIIFHDDMNYPRYSLAKRIGIGNVSGCQYTLDAYPLGVSDMCRRPASMDYDVVVGGRLTEDPANTLASANLGNLRIAVAVTGDNAIRTSMVEQLLKVAAKVDVFDGVALPTISAFYRTCPTVVHLGDCRRGYLHSLAMYHTSMPGRRLVERIPGEHFNPPTMEEFLHFFE